MRYKLLGASGLRVSELALGTMTFGETWGWGASKEESRSIFDAFAEAGGNFVDTANNYTDGTSEQYVGDFVASDREHFVIATKCTLSTRRDDPNAGGNHRKNMVQALEGSLRRLRSEEHTSELQSQSNLVCRLLLENKNNQQSKHVVPVTGMYFGGILDFFRRSFTSNEPPLVNLSSLRHRIAPQSIPAFIRVNTASY